MKYYFLRFIRRFWRRITNAKRADWLVVAVVVVGVVAVHQTMPTRINPAAYTPLLSVIAKAESNGNYNAHFGNATNTNPRFTDMTVADVQQWQRDYIAQGKASNAVGRYQFMGTTLSGLVHRLGIDVNARFDEALQDRLAIALMERRGSIQFVEDKISRYQFAASLSQEWAALPKIIGDNPTESYYAGDGLNTSRISPTEILAAVETLKQ